MTTPSAAPPPSPPGFDSLEQEAFLNLWRTYDRLKSLEDALFAPYGISAQQYNALRLLRSVHPGALPTLAVGAQLVSRAPDMTRMFDRLEAKGLVARTRAPQNRRVVEVEITRAGLDLLDELAAPVRDMHRRQLGHLDEANLRRLIALLKDARRPHPRADDRTSPPEDVDPAR